ncbi:MAG: Hsp33 family molecular chaperone HslO [Deltaproteobacteria bacterium]|nr:Hsp33 family molecular chaperone HslO [Deltaproteobacteria bacterium]MBW1914578.1 Hsp33 family molecular chaperone HslO [Deltaproteobacteria bacterium]
MIKKKIFRDSLKDQLRASARDKLYSFLLADGDIRGGMVHGTKMINEMRVNHELGILETLVLGHGYLAGSLMGGTLKGNDRLSIQIECSGPIKGLTVETNAFGEVRGFLKNVPIPVDKPLEDFNLSPFFGAGFLTITKYLEDAKQPFSGKVMIEHGSIAKDLVNYYLQSEQIPSSLNLSIQFDKQGSVIGAGGIFLQVMPGAGEKTVENLEKLVFELPSIGEMFSKGIESVALMSAVFKDLSPEFLGDYRIEFMCHCSKDRIKDTLRILPDADLKEIHDNGPFPVEIRCHNCNTSFQFSEMDIRKIYHLNLA